MTYISCYTICPLLNKSIIIVRVNTLYYAQPMYPILLSVAFLIVVLITFLVLFVSRRNSPIPYFPSNKQDVGRIISVLKLQKNQIIYELGAGDGIVVFHAASATHKRRLNTQFVAIEINPLLILVMHVRRLFHPNKHNISIQRADIFTTNYELPTRNLKPETRNSQLETINHQLTFFTYISPWYMQKTIANAASQLPDSSAARWVSYFYDVPRGPYRKRLLSHESGVHDVYAYEIRKK